MKSTFALILLGCLLAGQATSPATPAPVQSADEVRAILVERIDVRRQGVGAVVGVIDAAGRRIVAYGGADTTGIRPVNGDSIFEIGSATKVFTSLLLADAARRGEMAPTDPVSKYLPADVKVPQRGGKQITLLDLAMHTSGLPRLPSNLAPKTMANPYADYSVQQLYSFLSSYELTRDIGERYEYSNLGAGLLGHVLSRRTGMDYETLVRTRIARPLEMNDTRITLTEAQTQRLAPGHNAVRQPVSNWDLPTLAGAGALRSTANDLLKFLAAQLGYAPSPLAESMASLLVPRRATATPSLHVAMGWHVLSPRGTDIVWHNGGTGGYRSFFGFNAKEKKGVVVLSNMSTPAGMDDIGRHLLDAAFPLAAK